MHFQLPGKGEREGEKGELEKRSGGGGGGRRGRIKRRHMGKEVD